MPGVRRRGARAVTRCAPVEAIDAARDGDPRCLVDVAPNRTPPTLPSKTVWTPAGVTRWPVAMMPGSAMARAGGCAGAWKEARRRGGQRTYGMGRTSDVRGWDGGRMSTYQRRAVTARPALSGVRFDEAVTRRFGRPTAGALTDGLHRSCSHTSSSTTTGLVYSRPFTVSFTLYVPGGA